MQLGSCPLTGRDKLVAFLSWFPTIVIDNAGANNLQLVLNSLFNYYGLIERYIKMTFSVFVVNLV